MKECNVMRNGIRATTLTTLCLTALLYFMLVSQAAAQNCPVGSFPWVDNWGNSICKSFDTGQTRLLEGTLDRCPPGTFQWVDNWGNRICKSFGGSNQFYDTSEGCPIGTYSWVDNWGNPVCKRF